MLAWRSAPESNASRESLAWTRSTRPVIALTRSTMPSRSSPPACAWQVSRQKPTPYSPITSHSRASASKRRTQALSPPAVFSIRIGQREAAGLLRVGEGLPPVVDADLDVDPGADMTTVHDESLRADLGGGLGVLQHELAAGDADAVVGRRDVHEVRRVNVDVDRRAGGVPRRPRAVSAPRNPVGWSGRTGRRRRRGRRPPRAGRPNRRGPRYAYGRAYDPRPTASHPTGLPWPMTPDAAPGVRRRRAEPWLRWDTLDRADEPGGRRVQPPPPYRCPSAEPSQPQSRRADRRARLAFLLLGGLLVGTGATGAYAAKQRDTGPDGHVLGDGRRIGRVRLAPRRRGAFDHQTRYVAEPRQPHGRLRERRHRTPAGR